LPADLLNGGFDVVSDLPVAVRVYPNLEEPTFDRAEQRRIARPDATLVFDCETRTDESQALTFGSYRWFVRGQCLEEGLFYADDLTRTEKATLARYAATHRADVGRDGAPELKLLTLRQFLEKLYQAAYKGRCLVLNFNSPFDWSRCSCDYGKAQGRFLGGFSLVLWQYRGARGRRHAHPYRVRIAIKHIDSKRALKGFTGGVEPDDIDRVPEGSATGKPVQDYVFRGHILDLRTLAFALTDRGHSLKTACEAFGVEHGKIEVQQHGIVTPAYVDYNRRDVQATAELAQKVLAEYDLHPIALQATKAYSAASIGKAYLRAMRIDPILQRMPRFRKRFLGYAQSAFYGGRTSAHIRKIPVPVVYTDFLSQYSTVNVLMGLWRFIVADKIRVVENCAAELEQLLREVTPEWVLDQSNWKPLAGFARVIPDGDVLPLRAKYGSSDWQIGLNQVYAASDDPKDGLWYAWPDLVASVLLTGKLPRIVEAFRIESIGTLRGLKLIHFRGQVPIDPSTQDFFRAVIEERVRLARRGDLDKTERDRLTKSLRTLGSATSYGIFAQMDRRERDEKVSLTCYGIDAEPYTCRVEHPETSGEFCFPPLAALITSGGHLLLALLERLVADRGGTYAMEDTDSSAILAAARGGLIACPGGPYRTKDGREAVRALSWAQVREIVALFAKLNPYDRNAVPDSILKIEDDNFDPVTGKQRQLWCYAISAKRYALFLRDRDGQPILLRKDVNNGEDRWSEHGLGHLLNPTDPNSDDRDWIAQVWLRIIRKTLGRRSAAPAFESLPAIGRTSVSSPWVMRSLATLNRGKPYAKQIKPFNFLLTAHIRPFGHPIGIDPERFHLIAPFESNPNKWLMQRWIDVYSTKRYRVTTSQARGPKIAGLLTYGDVLREYEYHEELKCAGPDGKPCARQTTGLLGRRHVRIAALHFIGKESNLLEEVEEGTVHDLQTVYTEYPDPRRDRKAWLRDVVPKLKAMPLSELQERTGLSRATLQAVRRGRMPHPKNVALLTSLTLMLSIDSE
jgi:hypothetical protein